MRRVILSGGLHTWVTLIYSLLFLSLLPARAVCGKTDKQKKKKLNALCPLCLFFFLVAQQLLKHRPSIAFGIDRVSQPLLNSSSLNKLKPFKNQEDNGQDASEIK